LKALLQQRHLQTYSAFCREYDRVAHKLDAGLVGTYPSRAQFHRWISGELKGLPYAHHCRMLEEMLSGWTVAELFAVGPIVRASAPPAPRQDADAMSGRVSAEVVALYAHRSDTPRALWLDLLKNARREITLMANASLFLPEDNPESIGLLREQAAAGVQIRIALGDPDSPEVALRGVEERLYEGLVGRVRMAIAYYRPLLGVSNIEFRLHRTTLYNSIFVYDDEMLINQHAYGVYGYMAPILHLRRTLGGDMFDMYARSLERVWEAAYPYVPADEGSERQSRP